ncbi:hypothetical protein DXG03_000537 [Asterophora parasitica]|uniref:Uncharacterized protein n=1 Tax=Asterophora parasitica TaxID=117018 RepID=A0A9P7GAI0_9AGAR|nr:hypothetical protein DXG03_000537 [Asterophora parasitica]
MVIHCNRDRETEGTFQPIAIRPDHPIHRLGETASVSKVIKLPLTVYRHERKPWMDRDEDASLDNQIATYLMINSRSGYAPPEYQKQVGTITVMRKDGKPLTEQSIETIWMFHDYLLELFGDVPPIAANKATNRPAFDRFCQRYKDEKLLNDDNSDFRDMDLPL